jgi:DNA-directed RNA polymerase subunit RPC12/RpoP
MAKKELGYVELEWTCKRCGTKNPGLQKTCTNCGAPITTEDQFELPQEQMLIKDAEKLEKAQKGPDIHCPYCGTANPAGSSVCIQCGGDLKEGAAREQGKVIGAHTTAPVPQKPCPYCSQPVAANAPRCPHCGGDLLHPATTQGLPQPAGPQKMPTWMMIAGALVLLACCVIGGIFIFLSMQTTESRGQVQGLEWVLSVQIMEQRPVEREDWEENLPSDAEDVQCAQKYRETRLEPVPNATEVCGTPYTIDTGSGAGQVVQDCEYRVYASSCTYTVLDWTVVDTLENRGYDNNPSWPSFTLRSDQREGERSEFYSVTFDVDGQNYTYRPADSGEFSQYSPGSEWTVSINGLGAITNIVP